MDTIGIPYAEAPTARVSIPFGAAIDLVVAVLEDDGGGLDPIEVATWTPVCVARPEFQASPEVSVPCAIDAANGSVTISVGADTFPTPGVWPFAVAVDTGVNTLFYAVKGHIVLDRTTTS